MAHSRLGQDVSQLGPARVFSLNRLVALSEGRISQPLVDGLVREVHGGRLVIHAEPATAAVPEPVGPFAAFRPPAGFWSEGSFWSPPT